MLKFKSAALAAFFKGAGNDDLAGKVEKLRLDDLTKDLGQNMKVKKTTVQIFTVQITLQWLKKCSEKTLKPFIMTLKNLHVRTPVFL